MLRLELIECKLRNLSTWIETHPSPKFQNSSCHFYNVDLNENGVIACFLGDFSTTFHYPKFDYERHQNTNFTIWVLENSYGNILIHFLTFFLSKLFKIKDFKADVASQIVNNTEILEGYVEVTSSRWTENLTLCGSECLWYIGMGNFGGVINMTLLSEVICSKFTQLVIELTTFRGE